MLLYHFICEKYGIEAITNERLKVARIESLNDPFEYFHINTENYGTQKILKGRRKRADREYGIICFSENYTNPVQWAHYADSHRGICLGFEIGERDLIQVEYVSERTPPGSFVSALDHTGPDFVRLMLSKKYLHWSYEQEHRKLIRFGRKLEPQNLYFEPFSDDLMLKEVIIGCRSRLSQKEVRKFLPQSARHAVVSRVTPSSTAFSMRKAGVENEPT